MRNRFEMYVVIVCFILFFAMLLCLSIANAARYFPDDGEASNKSVSGYAAEIEYAIRRGVDKTKEESNKYTDLGYCRITTYCPHCNDPSGYQSSSGVTLEEGYVACRWLPNGTHILIDDTEYIVMDYCGTDAIDIFVDTDRCYCNLNEYRRVRIIND